MADGPSGQPQVLRGQRAVVTGGAAGIGQAVASRLTAEGAAVMIVDVDADAGQQTAERLSARFVVADLSTLDGARTMITAAQRELGGLDVLVNNAGGVVKQVYPSASVDHWMRMLDLNLRGVMLSTQLAIDVMDTGGTSRRPPAMPAEQVADAVLHMLTDQNLAGRVLVCQHDQPRTVLLPTLDWSEFVHAMSNLPNA